MPETIKHVIYADIVRQKGGPSAGLLEIPKTRESIYFTSLFGINYRG
jgi:hypothetical protein